MCPEWCLPTPEHGSGRHPSRMTATTPGGPKPKPSSNSKPSDTKSLSNHSPKSPNTCRSHPPATGHQIFSSETQAAPICGGSRAFWVCSCKEKPGPTTGPGFFGKGLSLEVHAAHATGRVAHGSGGLLRLVGDDGLGRQEQRRDGRRVLQRRAGDLDRVGDAGGEQVLVLVGLQRSGRGRREGCGPSRRRRPAPGRR